MSDDESKLDAIGADLPAAKTHTKKAQLEESTFALERDRENNRHKQVQDSMKLGAIGRWFGTRDNAIVYIVAFLVILCALAVAALGFADATLRPSAFEFFKVVGIALVGFFAGRNLPSGDG